MNDCIFCKIIKGDIPAKKEFDSKDLVVFHDINPKAPIHLLFVPKKHISSLIDITENDRELLGGIMVKINLIANKLGLGKSGYKVVINNGKASGQIVMHLHLHLLGGWTNKAKGWMI